jgi:hypothetical protein
LPGPQVAEPDQLAVSVRQRQAFEGAHVHARDPTRDGLMLRRADWRPC